MLAAQFITHREAMPPVLVRRLDGSSAGQTVWVHWTAIDVFSTKTPRQQLRRELRTTLASLHASLQRGARVRMRKPFCAAVRDGTGDMALEAGATGDLDSVYDIPFSESAEEGGSTSMAAEATAMAALHGTTPQAHVRWDVYGGGAHWVYVHDLEVLPAAAASERAVALQRAFDAPLTAELPCFGDPCASIQTEFWQMASFHASANSVCDRVTLLGAFDPATFDGIVTSAAVPMRGGSSVHFPPLRWGSSHGVSIWVRPQHTPKLSKKKMPTLHSNSSSMQTILATRPHGTAALARLLQLELGDDGVLVVHVAGGRGARARGVVLPTSAWSHVVLNVERGKAALFVNGSAFALQQPTRGSAADGVRPSAFRAAVEWTVGCLFIPSAGTDDAQEDRAPGSCTQPLTADVDGLQILARPWSVGELRAVANRRKKIDGVPVTDVFFHHEEPKPKGGGGGEGGGEAQHQSDEL
jgi:hypothetical protein